jgi:hypothetical protein
LKRKLRAVLRSVLVPAVLLRPVLLLEVLREAAVVVAWAA